MEDNLFGCSKTNERMKIGFWGGEVKKGRRDILRLLFCEFSAFANSKKQYGVGRKACVYC